MRTKLLIALVFSVTCGLTCHADKKQPAKGLANTIAVTPDDNEQSIIAKAVRVVPTANQLAALKNEFIAFAHFGPNTFTRREWGTGKEDPKIFALKTLDTDQWCKAMKDAGMKMVIFTAKHHDGFCLWQSRYTTHGIMSSDFQGGKGDVMRDLSRSCQKYGLKLGIYLSPADLYQIESPDGLYGNLSKKTLRTIPREVPGRPFANKTKFKFVVDDYNEYFLNQLFELLTEYGPISEVWFDGAHPKRKGGQTYNYAAWKKLIHTLAPKAVIFGREDVRWCGNEAGRTRDTEWNVIPYQANPDTLNHFEDMTAEDLGSRQQLMKAKYLHYQEAETNTSIREGWFYRDDDHQKVRSADDVFDIYERAVGGNSTFLLNIPPNREGRFSQQDVDVLEEVGKRIRQTYGTNLMDGSDCPQALLDGDISTYVSLKKDTEWIVTWKHPVTFDRVMLQEPINISGERVEEHAVDAWIDGQWKEIAHATNIGYKRILRMPDVTTTKIRVRIIASRAPARLSTLTLHHYATRPPQLQCRRDKDGRVTITPKVQDFNWNTYGQNAALNLSAGYKIYYTTDGTEPTEQSTLYTGPFEMGGQELKAVAVLNGERGPVLDRQMGVDKRDWKLVEAPMGTEGHDALMAFDENPATYWKSADNEIPSLTVDLGRSMPLSGFAYTPPTDDASGMMAKGIVWTSNDGKQWDNAGQFDFGNLINDPSRRLFYLDKQRMARYVRIQPLEIANNGKNVCVAEIDVWITQNK